MSKDNIDSSRRRFLRNAGFAALGLSLASCASKAEGDSEKARGTMTYRTNPNTGDTVSILGYGCMRFPTIGMANGTEDQTIDQETVNKLIDKALENGVNYFDTSPAYCKGHSEEATGIALARHPRDKYYIATKLSNFAPQTWPREKSIEMFENSLKYLRTDYIDYLLLHAIGGGGMENFNNRYINNGILDYLKDLRTKGTIRNLGFSFHGDIEVFENALAMHDRGEVHWDFVQIQLNYLDWNASKDEAKRNVNAEYLYNELHRRGIPAVIMEPLLGGRLANVPLAVVDQMKARRPDDSVASWAFRFAGTPEGILTVLSGMTYMDHLNDNLATYSPLEPISADEDAFLTRAANEIRSNNTIPCNYCNYCMPCPYGLDIPAILTHYNRCIIDGNRPQDATDPDYAAQRRAFLYGYDNTVPRLRQADRCVACGTCVGHCPQSIDIPAELLKIDRYVENLRQSKA